MKMKKTYAMLFMLALSVPLRAEEPAPLRTVAVLKFAVGKSGLSKALFADAEAGMRKTLAERGGYSVRAVDLSLDADQTSLLFEKLKEAGAGTAAASAPVVIGETTINGEVFAALLKASVLVIPSVVDYAVVEDKRPSGATNYKVTLKTGFDFIKRDGEPLRVTRLVETMGYDAARERALADAIKTIPVMFAYEMASIQEMKLATAIIALEKGEAVIERGGKQGVLLGTEFTVRGAGEGEGGATTLREKGLLVVSEVTDNVAVGTVVYADPGVAAGDAVEEVSRLGLDVSPYAFAFIPYNLATEVAWYAGVRVALAKGVYTLRPFLGVEFAVYPFSTYLSWFPVRPFVGCELRFRFGRFELAALPMIGLEEWFALAPSQTSTFMGFGLRGIVQASLLVSRDVKAFLEGGYEYWFGYRQGFLAGGGISIKL